MTPAGDGPLPGWLASSRLPGLLAAASVLLCLPALWAGFNVDDWMQQAVLAGLDPLGEARSPVWDFFAFADGEPERTRRLVEQGLFPWWAPPELSLRFMRPVTALTHIVDHRIAPGAAWFAHAHSLLWLLALVWLAGRLYRRFLGALPVAGLAALLFAVDASHGFPVGWIANRNALIAATAGVVVLLLHDRHCREGWRPGAVLAPLALAVGLLAGEAAIATVGWLVAYALCIDPRSRIARAVSLVPALLVVAGWRAAYSAGDFGARGQGLYIDPVADPAGFLAELPARLVALFADQLLGLPSLWVSFVEPPVARIAVAVAALALAALVIVAARALRGHPTAAFWALGTLASAVPVCATFPASRLLTFVALGAAPLVALFAERALAIRGPTRALALGLLVLHGAIAALALPARTWGMRAVSGLLVDPCDRIVPDAPDIAGKTVVFVNANGLCLHSLVYRRLVEGRARPAAMAMLGHAIYALELRGLDAHTVELRIPAGMTSTPTDLLFQPRGRLKIGDVVELEGMRVTVVSTTAAGHVDRIRARFERPLDDPDHIWIASRALTLRRITPPAPGEVLALPPTMQGVQPRTVIDAVFGGR